MLVAVAGARGGVGTTTLAVGVAYGLGAVLVDTDGPAGGVDVWLGGEDAPGVRWSGLGLAGGDLAAAELLAALPRVEGLRVLAADRADLPDPAALDLALDVLAGGDAVVDLGRRVDEVAAVVARRASLLLVVVPDGVAAAASAHVLVAALVAAAPQVPVGLVLTGRALAAAAVAAAVGAPVLAVVAGTDELDRAAAGLVDGLVDGSGVAR